MVSRIVIFLNTLIALEFSIGKKCKMSLVLMVKLLEYHVSGCMITNVINLALYVQLAFLHRDTWQLCIISCKDFFTNCIINVAKNILISSKFRKNLYVYLPVQRVFLLRVKKVTVCMCKHISCLHIICKHKNHQRAGT